MPPGAPSARGRNPPGSTPARKPPRLVWHARTDLRPHPAARRLPHLRAWAQAMPGGSFVATTNIDGLFFKAGFTDWQVVERHGNLHHYQCTVPCSDTIWNALSPALVVDSESLEIQGDIPACPLCGAVARPNVLMYDDVKWLDSERREQQRRFDAWLASVRGQRLVVIECGAGEGSASVRRIGERLLERSRVSLCASTPPRRRPTNPPTCCGCRRCRRSR